jgi:hypothetical protein
LTLCALRRPGTPSSVPGMDITEVIDPQEYIAENC